MTGNQTFFFSALQMYREFESTGTTQGSNFRVNFENIGRRCCEPVGLHKVFKMMLKGLATGDNEVAVAEIVGRELRLLWKNEGLF